MQLFLFLNDLAGRWPLLDQAARFFYVGALPALGTLLLAQLLVLPRSGPGVSRSKTALALVLALAFGALLVWGFDLMAGWLHLGNLSPRPWMTRRVNWLVVEPQDNSFPCVEIVLAAAIACASWKLNWRWGIVSWVGVVLLGLVRLFCGNNYFADVLVGAALGASSFVLCSQLCQRRMAFGQRAREFSLCASPLAVTLAGCYFFALLSPRFEGKLGIGRPAAAAPTVQAVGHLSTATSVTQGEGEGMVPEEGRAEELALAKRSSLFLPDVEAFLTGRLSPLARPFSLLDVEVAPVKAGTTSYRCAAIRFEVPAEQANMRKLVTDRAARLVQTAFALDSQMENVDIVAVARDQGRNLDGSLMTFIGEEVPVFTASIQRKNVVLPTAAANAPGVDGLTWLRARSRVYLNERALPDSLAPAVTPTPTGKPSAVGTLLPSPTPIRTVVPQKTPNAQSTPSKTPKSVLPGVLATATPAASATKRPGVIGNAAVQRTAQPQITARPKSTPSPRAIPQATRLRPTATAKAKITPRPVAIRTGAPSTTRPASRTPRPTRTAAGSSLRP